MTRTGPPTSGDGLGIRTGDIAKFGQLLLQKGKGQGTQLMPEAWGRSST